MLRRSRQSGFTLIELIIVVSILAVLASIGLPSFRDFVASQRIRNAASDLLADMMLARGEAIRRNGTVSIGPLESSWSKGWTISAGAETIRSRALGGSSLAVSAASGGAEKLEFAANGRSIDNFRMGFSAPNVKDSDKRCVVSNSAAGLKIVRGSCP